MPVYLVFLSKQNLSYNKNNFNLLIPKPLAGSRINNMLINRQIGYITARRYALNWRNQWPLP